MYVQFSSYHLENHPKVSFIFSPTVEEVATNGESETATEEVTAAASENGANGVHKETTEEKTEEKTESTESDEKTDTDKATEE